MKLVLTPGMGIGPEVTARALKTLGLDACLTLMGDAEKIEAALQVVGLSYQRSDDFCDGGSGIRVVLYFLAMTDFCVR